MSPSAAHMLVSRILPLIAGAVARGAVKAVGTEDGEELQAEGCALAATMLDAAEAKGKAVPPATSVAYYTVQALKSGRRSGYAGRKDVMSPGAALDGVVQLRSMDEGISSDEDDPNHDLTLHDLLAAQGEPVDVSAARHLDWDMAVLSDRERAVVRETAEGYGTGEQAERHNVSPPRIVQIHREVGLRLQEVWGGDPVRDTVREPAWRQGLRAVSERRACRYLRRG
jgi:hypothetical protein